MPFTLWTEGIAIALLVGVLGMLELGRRIGRRHRAHTGEELVGLGPLEGSVFTLLGLLLAFTFSGAAGRFDDRRQLVGEETNRIETAWLRLELLAEDDRPALRQLFRDYVDARLDAYRLGVDDPQAEQARQRAVGLQRQIWSSSVAACTNAPPGVACMLLLPALNDMIDVTTTRLVASLTHPPPTIYAMLIALTLAAALLSGYGTAANPGRSWLHRVLFAAAIAVSVLVILDLEYPRRGWIRIDGADAMLVELRRSFDP